MAIGIISLLTPLEDRIERWATSGNAKQILLHPEDYVVIEKKKDIIETKYNLPVVCLGGDRGLRDFLKKGSEDEETEIPFPEVELGDE